MMRAFVLAMLTCGLVALPGGATGQDEPKLKLSQPAAKSPDLQQKVTWNTDLKDTPLFELLAVLAKQHNVTFIIMEEYFKAAGVENIREAKPNVPAKQLNGLTLGAFLDTALQSVNATFVVRPDYIEITTPARRLQEKVTRVFPAEPAADPVAKILSALHNQRITYDKQLNDTPLFELLHDLAKRYDLTFVIRDEAFKAEGFANFRESKPNLTATRIEGITLHRFLTSVLQDLHAAYLIRDGYIEITTPREAQMEAGLLEAVRESVNSEDPIAGARAEYRLTLPLVSVVAQNQSLDAVLTGLARSYGLNVVISPDARGRMKEILVSERLLNVPADTALEVLAGQGGYDVVRKGNTFRIGFGVGA